MKIEILATAVFCMALTSEAMASGACPCQPPPPPRMKLAARGESLDNARYALGKQIYTGRLPLPERANARLAASQRPRLEAAAPKLASLAGRLTEDQLSALEYYVSRRN